MKFGLKKILVSKPITETILFQIQFPVLCAIADCNNCWSFFFASVQIKFQVDTLVHTQSLSKQQKAFILTVSAAKRFLRGIKTTGRNSPFFLKTKFQLILL